MIEFNPDVGQYQANDGHSPRNCSEVSATLDEAAPRDDRSNGMHIA